MARRRSDDDFDQRLDWEIIVDANGPEEQALGWYYYLENHLRFPFKARCTVERPTSPLGVGDVVEVRGLPAEEVCEHEMFVNIAWQTRLLAVPLIQLMGLAVDEGTEQAIQDWHTWVDRGYQL
jgi:calcium binding protein